MIEMDLQDHATLIASALTEKQLLESELLRVKSKLDLATRELSIALSETVDTMEEHHKAFDSTVKLAFSMVPHFENPAGTEAMRWHRASEMEKELGLYEIEVQFDTPEPLFLTILRYGWEPQVVDVIKSIEVDIRNLGNPIILGAIERYKEPVIALRKEKVRSGNEKNEDRQPPRRQRNPKFERVLQAIAKPQNLINGFEPFNGPLELVMAFEYSSEVFARIIEIRRSPAYIQIRTVTNQVNHINRQIRKCFPEIDPSRLLNWIKDRYSAGQWPKRSTPARLKNDFLAWTLNIDPASAKSYASRGKPIFEELMKEIRDPDALAQFFRTMREALRELADPLVLFPITVDLSKLEFKRRLS